MKHLLSIICLLLACTIQAQSANDPVLLRIEDKEVTKSEFETIYKKNNRDSIVSREDLDEYIELFVNFKLKVMEAEAMGRDTASHFVRELNGYREQLARPYLVDKAITDSLVRQAYDRMQTEVRAMHILIKLPPDPSPADTAEAHRKIMDIKKKVLENPDSFGKMAKSHSEDPSAKSNEGDLGFFTSLQMVYPFENLVYQTPVGEIGGPIRTRFGYHLVKTTDKRQARGQVRVAHIMVRSDADDPDDVKENNENRIREVYARLTDGGDFSDLARKFSDDRSSAARGGELPAFGTGKMVGEFEAVAFGLDEVGDYSEPFSSPYGWHVVKLLEKIPVKSYEEMEKDLRNRIGRDSRSDIPKTTFINKRKKEYNFKDDKKALKPFYQSLDTSYFSGNWKPSDKLARSKKTLFTLDGNTFTQADFLAYLEQGMRPGRSQSDVANLVNDSYEAYVNKVIMDYEDSRLEEKHPDFRALLNEYRDGILLFDLTDEKVWSRAISDSAGLADYFTAHKDEYMWEERAGFDIYTVEDQAAAKKVIKMLKKGKNQDDIREALNERSSLKVRIESGLKERDEVAVLSKVDWKPGISNAIEDDGQIKVVHVKEIRPAEHKAFDEARGLITAGYQNYLEARWIEELRSKYKVEVNRDVLYEIQ